MVADHWFMQVEKVLEAMEITSDKTRIRLAAFQLEGEAQAALIPRCEAPKPEDPLTTRQPAENLYVSYHMTHT